MLLINHRTSAGFLQVAMVGAMVGTAMAQHVFWYQSPAKDWNSAMPVGNGRMGAMVYGHPNSEQIQLNEDSMWPSLGEAIPNHKGTPADLAKVRSLIDAGKHAEADQAWIKTFSIQETKCSHQTLGTLHLKWTQAPEVTQYRRELNLQTAVALSSWKVGETTYTQQVFASNPDETLYVFIRAEGPQGIDLDVSLDRPLDQKIQTHTTKTIHDHALEMTGQVTQTQGAADSKKFPEMKGVKFRARVDAQLDGGTSLAKDQGLQIRQAKSVCLRMQATTDFWSKSQQDRHMKQVTDSVDLALKRHIKDHQSLYARCQLNLPTDPAKESIPTNERFAALTADNADLGLEALMFHFGRYLLIASSRENGNPANLQGLWTHQIAAPWNADYHLNINLQMNYWPADVTNLSDTRKPLFSWLQKLAKNGEETAKVQYGMRGWMSHHCTELDAKTPMHSARAQWGGWIHGGGWMCQDIRSYYDFTGDKEFLRSVGYPLLAGHARFYLDWLVQKDGKWISSPETSPENEFKTADGKRSAVCAKGAMGQQIITELLTNTLDCAKELGIEDALTKEISAKLPLIDSGLHIGPDGRLLEWDQPYAETEPGHRHLSHLYAFHPGHSVTQEKTPEIFDAVKKSIEFREKHGSVGIGWSRAWAISIYARLRDGNVAERHLHTMLQTQTLDNGFNSVFGRKNPLFQIEANLGATAGVAEMLIQSHRDIIHLLPALPTRWPNGSVTGLKARGGYTVNLSWKDGKIESYQIMHPSKKTVKVLVDGKEVEVSVKKLK